jgi:membrane-associated phospholipid phosphatase
MSSAAALTLAIALTATSPQSQPPAGAFPPDRPVAEVVTNLGRDFLALPSRETALIASVGALGTFVTYRAYDDFNEAQQGPSGHTPFLNALGDAWVQGGAAIATYAIGIASHQPKTADIGSELIRAQLLNGVMTRGLKLAVHRDRPSGGDDSFPSGHTSAMFASAAVLDGHFGWKVAVPAYTMAGLAGWARARDQHHWVSDLMAGGTIGLIAGRVVTRSHRSDRRWAVMPSASLGRVEVVVVRLNRRGGL